MVGQLAALDALRPALQREEAADVLRTLDHPGVWHLLVRGRGWSGARYEQWLHEPACLQLLAPSPDR